MEGRIEGEFSNTLFGVKLSWGNQAYTTTYRSACKMVGSQRKRRISKAEMVQERQELFSCVSSTLHHA
jgi:hypothetical protein